MRRQTKLVKIGNGLAVRLPKKILDLVDFKPGQPLEIEVRPDRLIIRTPKNSAPHELDRAYKDFKAMWQRMGEDAWVEIFGPDYDGPGPHYGT
jgi:antitoxin component of MazEF toxin-antitoxin module